MFANCGANELFYMRVDYGEGFFNVLKNFIDITLIINLRLRCN